MDDDLDLGPTIVHPLAGDPWTNAILETFGVEAPGFLIADDVDPFADRTVSGRDIDDAALAAKEVKVAAQSKGGAPVAGKAVPRPATRSLPKNPGPGFGFIDEPPIAGEEATGTYAVEVSRKGKGPKKK